MDLIAHFRQTMAHNAWANEQVAESLRPIAQPPAKAVLVLAHIVGAERLWYSRIVGNLAPEVWPALNVAQCIDATHDLRRQWTTWSQALTIGELDRDVSYVNSKGEPWTNTVREVIAHLTHHSSYHRGQVATLLGATGHMPAYTDFIHAVRQGYLEQS